jgi:hypothetical protein
MTAKVAAKVEKVVRKTKKLHWDKVQAHSVTGTVWENAGEEVGLNLEELDTLFSNEDLKKSVAKLEAPKKKQAVQLIDGKRSMNISIGLGSIKIPFKTIKEALLAMDDTTLEAGAYSGPLFGSM